MDIFAGKAL